MNFFGRAPAPAAKPRVSEKDHMAAIGKLDTSLKKAETKQDFLESQLTAKRRKAAQVAQNPRLKPKALLLIKESKAIEKRLIAARHHYMRLHELKNAIDVVADQRESIDELQTHLKTFNDIKGQEDLQEQADDVMDAHAEAVGDAADLLDSTIASGEPLEEDPELAAELAAAMAEFGPPEATPAASTPAATPAATTTPAAPVATEMAGLPPMSGIPAAPTHSVAPAAPTTTAAAPVPAASGDMAALSDFLA